jgi:hypothetical protein
MLFTPLVLKYKNICNDRIQKFTRDGQFVTKWTNLGLSGGGNILEAIYIDVGPLEKVYMTDRDNNRV